MIVNYQTADLVTECLFSMADEIASLKGCRVQIVDNASGDDSVTRIADTIAANRWSDWASVLSLAHNGGFAAGNNAALWTAVGRPSACRYVLLLNPDTVVAPRAVTELVSFAEANPKVGIAGSRLMNSDQVVQRSAHRFPSPLGELEEGARLGLLSRILRKHAVSPPPLNKPHRCDWVSGASMLIRREVIDDIGLLDENFFLYFEEVDFCHRASKCGWETWYVPASGVVHAEGASSGIQILRRRPTYWFDSRRRFFLKHYGVLGLLGADLFWCIGRLSLRLRRLLRLGGQHKDPPHLMLDLLAGDCKALLMRHSIAEAQQ